MTKRIVLAALLGGIAMFAWESIAHMLTPLGDAGIHALPAEAAIQAIVRDTIRQPGFYFFPAPESRPGMTRAESDAAMTKAMERSATEPWGILVTYPAGRLMMLPIQLARQFAMDFLAMMIAAVLLSYSRGLSYGQRVVFVSLIGLIPIFSSDIPLWNWYGFPAMYTIAQGFVHLVGYIAGGLAVAKVVNPAAT
jgi:hypothetical protein